MADLDHLQESAATGTSGGNSISVNLAEVGNTTSGNTLVGCVGADSAAARTMSDDVNSGSYTQSGQRDHATESRITATQAFFANITGGDTTLTVDLTGNPSGYLPCCCLAEIEGNLELDGNASNPTAEDQDGNNVTFSAVTVDNNSILFAVVWSDGITTFDDTADGWVLESNVGTGPTFDTGHFALSASGSQDLDITTSSMVNDNVGVIVAYKVVAAGGGAYNAVPTIIQNYRNMGYK